MSDTTMMNIANIQVFAEDDANSDRLSGSFTANINLNQKYYLWQGHYQTIPMGMNGNPEQFINQLIQAIPGVNCLRVPFNLNSFNPDGTLHPLFESFLQCAAEKGLQLIFVMSDGDAQGFQGTSTEIADALRHHIIDDVSAGWVCMKEWLQGHSSVEDAVYGWELLNEPASYQRAVALAPPAEREAMRTEMVKLYFNDIVDLAAIVDEPNDKKILVQPWGYGGETSTLSQTTILGHSAIDAFRSAIGQDLVWSLHFYPGWMNTGKVVDPLTLQEIWGDLMAPLLGDDILMTEINATGASTYNPFQPDQINTATALSLDWLISKGVGIGWFPALQTGASGLALIERDGDIRYLNQASLATALNAFSFGQNPDSHNGPECTTLTLVEAVLRNQVGDLDYESGRLDLVSFAAFGFGYGGADTITGSPEANNFLFGGTGDDQLIGSAHDDYLFGQDGNDYICSGLGIDCLVGGNGNDTLVANGFSSTAYGGEGADKFVLGTNARLVVVDYSSQENDTWLALNSGQYIGHSVLDANADGKTDLILHFSDGSEILFLSQGGMLEPLCHLRGGPGSETLRGTLEDDVLMGSDGADLMDGGGGFDYVSYNTASGSQLIDLLYPKLNTNLAAGDIYVSIEGVIGGRGSDNIRGTYGDDILRGEENADFLFGRRGNDLLDGGIGNDVLLGGVGADTLVGGTGRDRVQYSEATAFVLVDLEFSFKNTGEAGGDTFFSIEDIAGSAYNDVLFGDGAANQLYGRDGSDLLVGREGNDYLNGGAGNDTLSGGSGNDVLRGGAHSDTFVFSVGNDTIEDFRLGDNDHLKFDKSILDGVINSIEDLMNYASVIGNSIFFEFSPGQTLTLKGFNDMANLAGSVDLV